MMCRFRKFSSELELLHHHCQVLILVLLSC